MRLIYTNARAGKDYCRAIPQTYFCAPLHLAADEVIHSGFPLWHLLRHLSSDHTRTYFVWTLSLSAILTHFLPRRIVKVVSVYQWGDISRRSFLARFFYKSILRRSDGFAVFDQGSLERLHTRKPVARIGVSVDYNFFHKKAVLEPTFDVIVVGSHQRLEEVVRAIANEFSVARVTQNPETKRDYDANPHPNVSLYFSVSYETLRSLYSRSRVAAIPVEDIEVPIGITAYYEAIAMELPIIARRGPSIGGFLDDSCTILVENEDSAEWRAAIRRVLAQADAMALKARRNNAARLSSVEGLKEVWSALLSRLG